MLMVRELTTKEIQNIWDTLDCTQIIKSRPFWEWNEALRVAYAEALFKAATVKQSEYGQRS